jgi:hypothetical protein
LRRAFSRGGDQDEYVITRNQRRHDRCKVAMRRVTENHL